MLRYKQIVEALPHITIGLGLWGAPLLFLFIIGGQIFSWAKTGVWRPEPISEWIVLIGFDLDRIYSPDEWIGLARIGVWVLDLPASIIIPVLWIVVFVSFASAVFDNN